MLHESNQANLIKIIPLPCYVLWLCVFHEEKNLSLAEKCVHRVFFDGPELNYAIKADTNNCLVSRMRL